MRGPSCGTQEDRQRGRKAGNCLDYEGRGGGVFAFPPVPRRLVVHIKEDFDFASVPEVAVTKSHPAHRTCAAQVQRIHSGGGNVSKRQGRGLRLKVRQGRKGNLGHMPLKHDYVAEPVTRFERDRRNWRGLHHGKGLGAVHCCTQEVAVTCPPVARSIAAATVRLGVFVPPTNSLMYARETPTASANRDCWMFDSERYVASFFMQACLHSANTSARALFAVRNFTLQQANATT